MMVLSTAETPGMCEESSLSSLTARTVSQPQYRKTASTTPAASAWAETCVVKNHDKRIGAKPLGCVA